MHLTTFDNPQAFLDCVAPLLEEREAENNLILGIANRLIRSPQHFPISPLLAAVADGDELLLAALRTPPQRLVIASAYDDPAEAIKTLVRHLADSGETLPGVLGPSRLAEAFARRWTRRTGQAHRVSMRERVYELRQVIPPPPVPGRLRLGLPDEEGLLADWLYRFYVDIFGEGDRIMTRDQAFLHLNEKSLYVWDNGRPVSMAVTGRRTRHGVTIGYVFTPPELRGRGYASACVAAVSQEMLAAGYEFCALFTDRDNPTSNKIYRAIGYHPLADFLQFDFEA